MEFYLWINKWSRKYIFETNKQTNKSLTSWFLQYTLPKNCSIISISGHITGPIKIATITLNDITCKLKKNVCLPTYKVLLWFVHAMESDRNDDINLCTCYFCQVSGIKYEEERWPLGNSWFHYNTQKNTWEKQRKYLFISREWTDLKYVCLGPD